MPVSLLTVGPTQIKTYAMLEILTWAGLFAVLLAGVMRAVYAYKHPDAYADLARQKYQHKIDSLSGKSVITLIDEAKIELVARRRELDSLGLEIDRLRQEKNRTSEDIFSVINRIGAIGLAASNKRKYVLDLMLAFAVGISTSILGNLLWSHFTN